MIIAVDFDGTIVTHEFPYIGDERKGAIRTLCELQRKGNKIILWTCRCGKYLQEAVDWLEERGFRPDAVNCNIGHSEFTGPKVVASMYIDDKNMKTIDWDLINKSF